MLWSSSGEPWRNLTPMIHSLQLMCMSERYQTLPSRRFCARACLESSDTASLSLYSVWMLQIKFTNKNQDNIRRNVPRTPVPPYPRTPVPPYPPPPPAKNRWHTRNVSVYEIEGCTWTQKFGHTADKKRMQRVMINFNASWWKEDYSPPLTPSHHLWPPSHPPRHPPPMLPNTSLLVNPPCAANSHSFSVGSLHPCHSQ